MDLLWDTNTDLQYAIIVNCLAILQETAQLRDLFTLCNLNLSDLLWEEEDEEDSSMMVSWEDNPSPLEGEVVEEEGIELISLCGLKHVFSHYMQTTLV